jgi:SAM-dependent methyltransferase
MKKNKTFFEVREANECFRRNKEALECQSNDATTDLLVDRLKPFATEISDVLEIDCGSGHRYKKMADYFSAKGFGVEPSFEAIEYIENTFPQIVAKKGFGDDVPFTQKFDLLHLGFLSTIDFDTQYPYSNPYTHQNGVFLHKQNFT